MKSKLKAVPDVEFKKVKKFQYYIQKQDALSKRPLISGSKYDENTKDEVTILDSMGGLGWELCGIVLIPNTPDAKFYYRRVLNND